ncbi:MAG TPA: hypothetical protein VMU14_22025 [Acidimicrobiales bacterium]|nr:hypothetical protein [Acidimicrobiales bacterium]
MTAVTEVKEMAHQAVNVEFDEPGPIVCPNCGAHDPAAPTMSDDGTTCCPKCGHRFPVEDRPAAGAA